MLSVYSASAASDVQTVELSVRPGKGMTNTILYPYYPNRDSDFGKLRDYITNEVEKTPVTLKCTSDGSVPMEDPDKLVERMCNKKNADCCILQVMKSQKSASASAIASTNESCFSNNSVVACFAVIGSVKKTSEALIAASKACDIGNFTACLTKASFLYGLRKDQKGAAEILESVCHKKFPFGCFMASLHAEKAQKDAISAAAFMKKACTLGFKYRCAN